MLHVGLWGLRFGIHGFGSGFRMEGLVPRVQGFVVFSGLCLQTAGLLSLVLKV